MIVHGEDAVGHHVETGKGAKLQGLVDVIAAVGVEVDLLQERQVGILRGKKRSDLVEVIKQALFGPRAGLGAAVHEKAEVVFIRAEADVPAEDLIGRSGFG